MSLLWIRILVLAALAASLFGGGYLRGKAQAEQEHLASQALIERAANTKLLRDAERGSQAQADLGQGLQQRQANYRQLERAFHESRRRFSLLTPAVPAVPGAPGAAAGGAPACPAAPPPVAAEPGAQAPSVLLVPVPVEPVLTAGAVWMWNSTLAGVDVPAGACGLADTSEGACAAATVLTLDDAWTNHAENARLCAEDRTRHQHLIDFIKGTK